MLIDKTPNHRTIVNFSKMLVLLLLCARLPVLLMGAEPEEFNPETHYGKEWTPDNLAAPADTPKAVKSDSESQSTSDLAGLPPSRGAEADLREWVKMKYRDPSGRPLPVTGSWMCEEPKPSKASGTSMLGWDPNYFVELIKSGHHVIPTFIDPFSLASRAYAAPVTEKNTTQSSAIAEIDTLISKWRPALEYCRQHKLPIAFRGFNMLVYPAVWNQRRAQVTGETISPEEDLRLVNHGIVDEKRTVMDPLGPVEGWRTCGEQWFNNPMMQAIQQIYPDPPMVIFLDNNEAGKVDPAALNDQSDRFVAAHGVGPHDIAYKAKVVSEGYAELLAAMFAGARAGCQSPIWARNLKFVAYNNLAGPYDGGMPEFYDNDWQPGKTDYNASLHSDAMNMFAFQDRVFDRKPDFHWSTIIWDGEFTNNIWRSRGRGVATPAKPFQYASSGERWDFDRYEGIFQFGLWMMRPKEFREFRGNPSRNAYSDGAWQRVLAMVDRPWKDPLLREFWRFGIAVPNRYEPAVRLAGEKWTDEARKMDRWYILKCDANPPRGEWVPEAQLRGDQPSALPDPYPPGLDPWKNVRARVFPIAFVLGDKPDRRWLIYAHAPLGAVANAKVQLPGFGDVRLDSVPLSGSFFLVKESDRSVQTIHAGGPAEIEISAAATMVLPETKITFDAKVTSPPKEPFTGFVWTWGSTGKEVKQDKLQQITTAFAEEGDYLVTVTGLTQGGGKVVAQQEVFVRKKPVRSDLYDLPLNQKLEWQGPWGWGGSQGEIMTTYGQLPNAGTKGRTLVAGGRVVEDEERGAVLEFSGDPQLKEGIWLAMDQDTVMSPKGVSDRTISFWFKAVSTEPRQILYADGSFIRGSNIYLLDGKLYAGSWTDTGWPEGGHWITAGDVAPGKWYQVTLVLRDAAENVADNKMQLYLDGKLVAEGPARRIPANYCPPRIGGMEYTNTGNAVTKFHDNKSENCQFKGRLSTFQFINRAITPEIVK